MPTASSRTKFDSFWLYRTYSAINLCQQTTQDDKYLE